MDVRIDIDNKFEKDLKKFSVKDQEAIEKKMNFLIELLRSDQNTSAHLYKLHKIQFPGNLDSSLHIFRVNNNIRILLTSEDDPIFGEHILTLLRVIQHKDLDKLYNNLAQSLYQSIINKNED